MAIYQILPSTNLKAEDIRDTLNANGGSVGNVTTDYFTVAAGIDPFARYKPVDHTKMFDLTEYESKGIFQDFNIDIVDANGNNLTGTLAYSEENVVSLSSYRYQYRTVNKSQYPLRMGDFRNYNPAARPFICSRIKHGQIFEINKFFNSSLIFYLYRNTDLPESQPYEITLSDIDGTNIGNASISNMHLCCLINASTWVFGGNSSKVGSSLEVSMDENWISEMDDDKVYDGYFFLADGYQIDDTQAAGLVQRIFPLPYDNNNVIHFKIKAINRIPATFTLTGLSVFRENFVPGSSNIISGNLDEWQDPSYYDYYYGSANGLSPYNDNNIIFRIDITDVTARFSVNRENFTMSEYNTGHRTRYKLYIQMQGESSANANASSTLTFNVGGKYTLYAICPTVGSVPYDVENQFTVYLKNAMICQTPWIMCN